MAKFGYMRLNIFYVNFNLKTACKSNPIIQPDLSMESKEFQDATSFLPWPKVNRQSSGLVSLQKTIGLKYSCLFSIQCLDRVRRTIGRDLDLIRIINTYTSRYK